MLENVSKVCALTLFTLLILLALGGNVLVCVAIFVDRKLRRQPENLFLVSLAISDLFVSVLVMIFAAANDLLGYWPFGEAYCQFWICFDITCSTASILNLCAIAFDRYVHISRPMKYSRYSNKSTIGIAIILVWLLSAFVGSAQLIFGAASSTSLDAIKLAGDWTTTIAESLIPFYDHTSYNREDIAENTALLFELDSRPTCHLMLRPLYAIFSSILSFFLPATIMVLLYTKLYLYARMHVRSIRSQLRQATSLLIMQLASSSCERIRQVVVRPCYLASHTALHYGTETTAVSAAILSEEDRPLTTSLTYENNNIINNNNNNNNNNNIMLKCSNNGSTTANEESESCINNNNKNCNANYNGRITTSGFVTVIATASDDAAATILPATTAMIAATVRSPDSSTYHYASADTSSFAEIKCNKAAVSDQKARITLGVIMGTFLICWLPFFIVNVLRSLFPHLFSQRMFQVVTWLGYANSTANPVIYGIFNRDFRRAFTRIVLKIFYCFGDTFDIHAYKQHRSPFFNHNSKF